MEEGAISQAISHIFCPVVIARLFIATLVFQLEGTVRLFGTLLLLDTIHFPKREPCLIIGSVSQIGAH